MENTILLQILGELKELKQGQQQTNDRLDRIETRLDKVEARLDNLETRMDNLETRMDNLETRMDKMEARLDSLHEDVQVLKVDVATIKDQLCDLEAKNANNHMEIKSRIEELSKDFSVLEIVSSKNMRDIAFLKVAK